MSIGFLAEKYFLICPAMILESVLIIYVFIFKVLNFRSLSVMVLYSVMLFVYLSDLSVKLISTVYLYLMFMVDVMIAVISVSAWYYALS